MAPEQQPPHCNGRQWMKPSFSPPLLAHFGCRHRRGDSDRFAWKKPFRFVRGGGGGVSRDAERGCPQQPQQQQHQAPFQCEKTNGRRWGWKYTDEAPSARGEHCSSRYTWRNGRDCFNLSSISHQLKRKRPWWKNTNPWKILSFAALLFQSQYMHITHN